MNITEILKHKKYVENGTYENTRLEKLADRYSQQEQESISHLDILFASTRVNTIIKNEVSYNCIVDYGKLKNISNAQSTVTREIWTIHSDGIKTGDILHFSPNSNTDKQTYLLLKSVETRGSYDLGIMQNCISSLKWIDDLGEVKETWFAYRLDFYRGAGQEDGRVLIMPSERRYIYIQKNSDTIKIKKEQRFIFDDRPWKVTAYDALLSGLIYLELEEDQYESTDHKGLRIANYYEKIHIYSVKILNGDKLSIHAGQTIQLLHEIRNNSTITNKPVRFYSSDENIATVDDTGLVTTISNGTVTITCELTDDPSVKDTTQIIVEFETTNNYSVSLDSEPIVLLNKSKMFTAIVKNNNVIDITKTVMWYLFDKDGISQPIHTSATFISTTQITLRANSVGYSKLVAVVVGTTQSTTFDIQVKGLF